MFTKKTVCTFWKFLYPMFCKCRQIFCNFAKLFQKKCVMRQLFNFSILLVAFLAFFSCQKEELYSIMPKDCDLRPGDIVFRLGNSLESSAVIIADRDGSYSHCGIVVDSAGSIRIVHSVPDEPDFDGDVDRVKMDRPEMFWRIDRAAAGAVCRMQDSLAAKKASEVAKKAFERNTLFDDEYDDKDTTKLYCSELVYYSYKRAGYDLVGPERHTYDLFFVSYDSCIMPSQIYNSKYVKPVRLFTK